MSLLEKVKYCLYPDFCRNRLASPSSTSTPSFKLQDYLEVPDHDRAAQRQALFSSTNAKQEWVGPKLATIQSSLVSHSPIGPIPLASRFKIVTSNKMENNVLEVNERCLVIRLPFAKL